LPTDKRTSDLVPKGKVFDACFTKNKHLQHMNQVDLVFDYTNSAFKAFGPTNDDGPG
jgi:hypothetical protein